MFLIINLTIPSRCHIGIPNLHVQPKLNLTSFPQTHFSFYITILGTKITIHSIFQERKLEITLAFSDQSSDPDQFASGRPSFIQDVLVVYVLYFRHHLENWVYNKKTRSLTLEAYILFWWGWLGDPQTQEKLISKVSLKRCN